MANPATMAWLMGVFRPVLFAREAYFAGNMGTKVAHIRGAAGGANVGLSAKIFTFALNLLRIYASKAPRPIHTEADMRIPK